MNPAFLCDNSPAIIQPLLLVFENYTQPHNPSDNSPAIIQPLL
jgi:hypothetical protein